MYRFHLLLLTIFSLAGIPALAQVKTVYLSSFGAVPNDQLSDQQAFNAAAAYINGRKGKVKLIIQSGKYIVGPVKTYGSDKEKIPTGKLFDVMNLTGCSNVTIQGNGNVQIKFADGLPFGTLPGRKNNADSAVHIGSLFRLINCSGITITNIKGDGNNQRFRFLNNWGAGVNPYEREHEGLFILNSKDITVRNCAFNSFGRDGAMILEDRDAMPVTNISFVNCSFDNNGRNGFSWCGGDGVRFYNCTFNYNSSKKIITNPGSGLDIEPERGAICKNGVITKCTFRDNGGYSVISGYAESSDVVFDSCTIIGNTIYSLMCQSPRFLFKNTKIAGTVLLTYDATAERDGTRIERCIFTDSLSKTVVYRGNYMLSIQGRFIRITNSTFNSYVVPSVYTEIRKKSRPDDPENTIFENCVFNARFKKSTTWGKWAFLVSNSKFVNCTFTTAGVADFEGILRQSEKNIYQNKNKFINEATRQKY